MKFSIKVLFSNVTESAVNCGKTAFLVQCKLLIRLKGFWEILSEKTSFTFELGSDLLKFTFPAILRSPKLLIFRSTDMPKTATIVIFQRELFCALYSSTNLALAAGQITIWRNSGQDFIFFSLRLLCILKTYKEEGSFRDKLQNILIVSQMSIVQCTKISAKVPWKGLEAN